VNSTIRASRSTRDDHLHALHPDSRCLGRSASAESVDGTSALGEPDSLPISSVIGSMVVVSACGYAWSTLTESVTVGWVFLAASTTAAALATAAEVRHCAALRRARQVRATTIAAVQAVDELSDALRAAFPKRLPNRATEARALPDLLALARCHGILDGEDVCAWDRLTSVREAFLLRRHTCVPIESIRHAVHRIHGARERVTELKEKRGTAHTGSGAWSQTQHVVPGRGCAEADGARERRRDSCGELGLATVTSLPPRKAKGASQQGARGVRAPAKDTARER